MAVPAYSFRGENFDILAELDEYLKRMSGKVKSRGSTNSANTLEAATTTLNERILKV